ncbi:MAG: hypothetical protein CBD97_03985 [Pelagibacteraceae bacterium TMED237]|nr:MAG: hypothetical protein CBD97_03985 [Pelagibacteraceae bacterium TMED237]|tara:strand:- start:6663 stop:8417 length:1755 start_codon:yes stop_codon:yes gene_type:complete
MKLLSLIFLLFFLTKQIFSNEVEVIELHESKSLDQMVLDQFNNTNINEDQNTETIEAENTLEVSNEDNLVKENNIAQDSFWKPISPADINNYLKNAEELNSKILKKEFSSFIDNLNLDLNIDENRKIYFLITEYFYRIGNLSKAYNLTSKISIENNEKADFYTMINFNYLLSTFQLEKVCNLKNNISSEIKLKNYLIEKIDIFCLILNENFSEAELINSILIETESNLDNYFQELYVTLINKNNDQNDFKEEFDQSINKDLIFLYSAMLRISDLPLSREFLKVDSKNLAIPIILNRATPIELRIQAANESYTNNNISIESLAALYQSVDFNSEQLNNPKETIKTYTNKIEILMAYYFQLINIQIFPSERLEALISFWDFAKLNNLEEIAYSLSYKIIQSVEISAENLKFSPDIATSYIYNKNYDKALSWIEFYENSNGSDENITYVRILLSLYSAKELNSIVEIIINNYDNFESNNQAKNEELIFILLNILNGTNDIKLNEDFGKIYDERPMPSLFITNNLNKAIEDDNYQQFLIYSIISLNNKEWSEIHPDHLNLILVGYLNFNYSELVKEIVLEIFKNYKIL